MKANCIELDVGRGLEAPGGANARGVNGLCEGLFVGPGVVPGRVAAFLTLRDRSPRTVGLLVLKSCVDVGSLVGDAMDIARTWRVPFSGPCAARGKVVFLDLVAGKMVVVQVEGQRGEAVLCGNAYVAGTALASLLCGKTVVSLEATDGDATMTLESEVSRAGGGHDVQSYWRVKTHPEDFAVEVGQGCAPVARVETLNSYEFSVGPRLASPVMFDSYRQKACRIIPGDVPELQVCSCNRFHGALPQTCAVDLQLARSVFSFIGGAVPSDTVRHPGGVEKLPACYWDHRDFVAVMPCTSVKFAEPIRKEGI